MNTISITTWALAFLGQVAADGAAGADTAASVEIHSVWDFVVKGGPLMIPIGLCSLVALTVIIERMVSLRRRNVLPADFLPGLKKVLGNGNDDRDEALEYCHNNGSPIANLFAAGIKRLGEPVELVEKYIQEAAQREVLKLRKYLRVLVAIASTAPLMGILGTTFGMITAFQTVAASSEALGKAELLAEGIYEAMITTAAGLLVTIPVLFAYHWLSAKIDRLVSEMDQVTVEFVEEYAQAPRAVDKPAPKLHSVDESERDAEGEEEESEPAAATA